MQLSINQNMQCYFVMEHVVNKCIKKTHTTHTHTHTHTFIRKPVIRIANYPYQLGRSDKFVENSTKLTCLEITGCRNKYSTLLWLLELQIRRGRKFQTQVRTVNSNSGNSNCQCSLFSRKNPIIPDFLHIQMARRPN